MKRLPVYLIHKSSGKKYMLVDENIIGRGIEDENTQANICLADDSISRQHALIKFDPASQRWFFSNISRNGSLVNSVKVAKEVALKHGDIISVGEIDLSFYEKIRSQEETMEMPIVKRRKTSSMADDWEDKEATPLGGKIEAITLIVFVALSVFLFFCCFVW